MLPQPDAFGNLARIHQLGPNGAVRKSRFGKSCRFATDGCSSSAFAFWFIARLHFAFHEMKKQVFGKCFSTHSMNLR